MMKNQETGATEVIYEQTRTSFQFWVGLLAQLTVIAVVVFAAAKFGVVVESKQVIEDELQPPSGIIYMGVEKCIRDELEPMKLQDARMEVRQETIMDDIGDIKISIKEIAKNGS